MQRLGETQMQRRHYEAVAKAIGDAMFGKSPKTVRQHAEKVAMGLLNTNPAFDPERFVAAVLKASQPDEVRP